MVLADDDMADPFNPEVAGFSPDDEAQGKSLFGRQLLAVHEIGQENTFVPRRAD